MPYVEDTYFCQSSNYDIKAGSGCYVDASDDYNIYSGDPDDYTYGNVDYSTNWDECGLSKALITEATSQKRVATQSAPINFANTDQEMNDFRDALQNYRLVKHILRQDFRAGKSTLPKDYESDYQFAIDDLKGFVENYAGTPLSTNAMGIVAACYWELEQPESVANYINSTLKDSRFC